MNGRKCDVALVPNIWYHVKELKKGGRNTLQNLVKALKLKDRNPELTIRNAVADGLLVETCTDGKTKLYTLPPVNRDRDTTGDHDWYCFECHNVKSGKELTICEGCHLRSFHPDCVSKSQAQVEKYISNKKRLSIPAAALTKSLGRNNKSRNSSVDTRSELSENPLVEALQHDIIISNSGEVSMANGGGTLENSMKTEFKKGPVSQAMKKEASAEDIKLNDVVFDKVVRDADPRSGRNNISLTAKPEEDSEDEMTEEEMLAKFCLNCRIQKSTSCAKAQNSIEVEEINYLLQFLFSRVKTWLLEDMYSQSNLSPKNPAITGNAELIREHLVRIPTSLKMIAKKLEANKYDQIELLHCDLLDVSHNLAVIHGAHSAEHEASKFLLNDTLFEISELKQCFDCYRHSNEKKDKLWFTKPCVPRHELVFAKVQGFEYWPAKVIRIVDGQYDVRFFGAGHTRALIDPHFVRSIENPPADSKIIGKLQKSIKELEKHQELLTYPIGTFSYASEKNKEALEKQAKKKKLVSPKKAPVKMVKTPAKKKKGEPLENPAPSKRPRMEGKSIDKAATRTHPSNSSLHVNEAAKLKSREPVASPEKPRKTVPATKTTDEKRESPRKRGGKNVSESHSEPNKSLPQQTEADSTLGSTLECFDLTSENASHSDNEINSSMAVDDDVLALENRFKTCQSEEEIKQAALLALQAQIKRHKQEINTLQQQHKQAITNAKTHEWCSSCENESRYYCCWNTTYCSKNCQQLHWQAGHKKMCRRKK